MPPKPNLSYLLLSIGLFASLETAWGANFSERAEWGITTQSLAGSGASTVGGLDGFLGNPANLAYFANGRTFGGSFQSLPHEVSSWAVGVIDGSSAITGGFQFQMIEEGGRDRQSYATAAAYKHQWAYMGASFRGVRDSNVTTNKGWHLLSSMGALFLIPGGLTLGIYGKNFLDQAPDTEFPPALYAGITYTFKDTVNVTAETSRHFEILGQDWNLSTSTEVIMKEYYLVRGGYYWSRSLGEDTFWAVGGGVRAQKLDMIFAFTQTTEDSKAGYSFELSFKF